MKQLHKMMDQAETSPLKRKFLQWALSYSIPFNRPHKFKILEVYKNGIHVQLPYLRVNKNHLNGIHACALATLCEFVSGLSLMRALRRDDLRLIMKDLKMTYHYQAKKTVSAAAQIASTEIDQKIISPLQLSDSVLYLMTIEVYDTEKNHICTAEVNWQLKKWNKVKTN